MLFNSYQFMAFFPIVLLVYFFIPKKFRYIWLLGASYYFYMCWNALYALLIFGVTVVTFIGGLVIDKSSEDESKKKLAVTLSVVICLLVLGFFKYYDFLLGNINGLLSTFSNVQLQNRFSFVLPVGISFYTFQALSYTIDVYKGKTVVEKNFLRFALFVSFFPQLVAGPIERSENLLRQLRDIENIKLFNYKNITQGATLMLWGYFLKMVIADRAAIFVDNIYSQWWTYDSYELCVATILFGIQVYCDFNSYSLIAMGAAKIMGFDLMLNFNTPYFATSISDHWKRWHISMSAWFKDYVYIPLGGSRHGKLKKWRNVMITFLVSGLWHGASWHYVAWGGLHGIYQILEDILKPYLAKLEKHINGVEGIGYKVTKILITDFALFISWPIFRADNLVDAFGILRREFTCLDPWNVLNQSIYNYGLDQLEFSILLFSILILFVVSLAQYKTKQLISDLLFKEVIWFRWAVILGIFFMIFIFGEYGEGHAASEFIYFQF